MISDSDLEKIEKAAEHWAEKSYGTAVKPEEFDTLIQMLREDIPHLIHVIREYRPMVEEASEIILREAIEIQKLEQDERRKLQVDAERIESSQGDHVR